jgi:hypothetical protein
MGPSSRIGAEARKNQSGGRVPSRRLIGAVRRRGDKKPGEIIFGDLSGSRRDLFGDEL